MKKAVSIVLVVLLMLNVMGYYGLFVGLKYRNNLKMTQRLDVDAYSELETITIKIPLAIPYYGDTEYQRVEGEIEHEGQFYRLVKQKMQSDTLHLVCIRDTNAERIHEALSEYVRSFADQSADFKTIPSLIREYFASTFALKHASSGWAMKLCFGNTTLPVVAGSHSAPAPPPEA